MVHAMTSRMLTSRYDALHKDEEIEDTWEVDTILAKLKRQVHVLRWSC